MRYYLKITVRSTGQHVLAEIDDEFHQLEPETELPCWPAEVGPRLVSSIRKGAASGEFLLNGETAFRWELLPEF